MKIISIIILSLFLNGCAFFKKLEDKINPPQKVVQIDPRVLEYCDLLPETVKIDAFEDAIYAYASLSTKYGACANKHAAGIKLLKQFSNVKEQNGSN